MPSSKFAAVLLAGLVLCAPQLAWSWQLMPPDAQPLRSPNEVLPPPASSPGPVVVAPAESADTIRSGPNRFEPYFDTGYPVPSDYMTDEFADETNHHWWLPQSITGQMIWLSRTRGSEEATLLSSGVIDPVTLVPVHTPAVFLSDLTLPTKIGARGSVMFGQVGYFQGEVTYLGIFDQSTTVRFSDAVDETGVFFFDSTAFTTVTDISQSYESDLHTAEFNVWCDDEWRVQGLFGVRWLQQSEELEQLQTFNVNNRAFTELRNELIGLQAGFRTTLFQCGRLCVFAIAKGGVFSNDVELSGDVQSGGVQLAAISQTESTTSYVGELNISSVWWITPYFNFHAGYTGLWLTQVAVLGDQLNNFSTATGTGTFDYGGISYQGGHVGLTLAW